jgi:hypothetical protein
MMETISVTLPAVWASALVNNDWSGIEFFYPEEAERAKAWLHEGLTVLSCSDEPFIAKYEGVVTECLEYQCARIADSNDSISPREGVLVH